MNAEQLLRHFDRISDAPDAIPRLRRFILDLAVRGKLVSQNPREEPACELLKRIQSKKAELVRAGEIRKQKPMPPIQKEVVPFQLPSTWQWTRLNDITSYIQRGKSPRYSSHDGLPVVSQKCVQWSGLHLEVAKRITWESIKTYESVRFLRTDDLVWNSTGTGTIGRIIRITEPPERLVCDSHVTVVRCLEVDAEYVRAWLRSDHVYGVIEGQATGSTNQVELTSQIAAKQLVPVSPLAEQRRIVARVDELMALCDRLEAAQSERENRRDRLASASLQRLNQPVDTSSFREYARFHLRHLPRLTTRVEHTQQLRQTILNLAVRGKLVPQNPNDKPTMNNVKRIGVELSEGEPYPIPHFWSWVRVDQVSESRLGKMLDKSKNRGTPRRYLRNVNLRWFDFDLTGVFEMRFEDSELDEFSLVRGDVLICEGGEPGRAAVWDEREKCIYFQKAIHRVRFREWVNPHFFVKAIRESADSGRLSTYFTGVGIKHLTGKGLAKYIFPLPPLAEQHRIVAKVDELMTICDQLEAQLKSAQNEGRQLLEAVLHKALATVG
jgi:type I restriction enzyme S subunit